MRRTLRNLDAATRERLRAQAILLKEAGLDAAEIGKRLGVTAVTARNLWLPARKTIRRRSGRRRFTLLPPAAVDVLVNGAYAALVARTTATRLKHLAKIGSLYTRADLLREQAIGRATLNRIEGWLRIQGYRLRKPSESVAEAMCRAPRSKPSHMSQNSFWLDAADSAAFDPVPEPRSPVTGAMAVICVSRCNTVVWTRSG